MKTNEFTIRARDLGTQWFRNNGDRSPTKDDAFNKLLVEMHAKDRFTLGRELFDAWREGYDSAARAEFV